MTILTQPQQITAARIFALRGMLSLECKGMTRSRGKSAYMLVKEEFHFKGNRERVLNQLNEWIEENLE